MIITRTPFRVSFFGGGTDYPVWYREREGMVISTSINKYCYITTRHLPPFFDYKYRIRYTSREERNRIHEINHPSVRECLRFLRLKEGIEMVHTGDLPAMSGLGSSSAFTVEFLHSLYALTGKSVEKKQLALEAIHVEQNMIGENVGAQDQIAAAVGGFNSIRFTPHGIHISPIAISDGRLRELEQRLLLFFTGFSRTASDIAADQIKSTPMRTSELTQMLALAEEAKEVLASHRPLDELGGLLDESWRLKRSLTSRISTPFIDKAYDAACRAGALGGKILGAGGGGFLLFYVPPRKQAAVKQRLRKLLHVPFAFEHGGTQVIYRGTP